MRDRIRELFHADERARGVRPSHSMLAWRRLNTARERRIIRRLGSSNAGVLGECDDTRRSRSAFGEVVAEYTSPVNGIVGGLRSDATSEPDNVLLFIRADAAPVAGAATCPEWRAAQMDTPVVADSIEPACCLGSGTRACRWGVPTRASGPKPCATPRARWPRGKCSARLSSTAPRLIR
jgi:hypothetical protein